MTDRRDYDIDAISQEDIFQEAKDRLELCNTSESENRDRGKVDILFREGDPSVHWDSDYVTSTSMEEPQLVINLTDALCQRVENNIKQQRPRGKCHPVGEGATMEIADLINGIGRHVEYRSEASVAYDQAAKSAITNGWGYFRLIAEYVHPKSFQKDLRILPIRNVFTVYMDPSSIMPTGADAGWCLISVKMKRTEYKRRFPRAENVDWNNVGRGDSVNGDWEDKEEIRLAEYFRIVEREEKLFKLRNKKTGAEQTFYESELPKSIPRVLQIDGERDSTRMTVEWFRLNGLKVVQRQQLPGSYIPVFRVEGNCVDVDGQVRRRGMVRSMSDPQRMVDYGEVAKIKRLGLAPKAPWVGAEGQFDGHDEWDNANREPFSKLVYKPVTVPTAQGDVLLPPPQRQEPAQIEQGFSEFVQGMKSNLFATAGMPNEPGADKQGEVVSGLAMRRRQYLSDQSHYQYYDNLTLAIAQEWRVIVEWVPVYFPEKGRIQRIIGEDGVPSMVTLKEEFEESPGVTKLRNDPSVGRYDVVMDTGPGFETKREEGAENMIQMAKIPAFAEILAKVAPDLMFRGLDYPYAAEVADRLAAQTPDGLKKIMDGLPQRARSIIQSMAQQNAQLKQLLQQAQLEQKYGLAKAHLNAVTKAHDTEVRAQTAKDDRELQVGADIFIEGMRHGHEINLAEREAQQLIERGENGNGSAGQ